jgi:hypothetical protein
MPHVKAPRNKTRKTLSRRERALRRRARNNARAAQVAPAGDSDDIDALRFAMARRIAMFIGNRREYWRGCREPCCRRARACIAPDIRCSNAPALRPDPDGRRQARAVAKVHRLLTEEFERARGEGT